MGTITVNFSQEELVSVIQKVTKINGWFDENEIATLYLIAKQLNNNSNILEIGSFRGRSTNAIGHAIQNKSINLYCLDIWRDFWTYPDHVFNSEYVEKEPPIAYHAFADFLHNIEWFHNQVRVLRGSTNQFCDFLPKNFFDLIFIDAAHDYENVKNDINISLSCLKYGGVICGHDYMEFHDGVITAVNETIFNSGRFKNFGVFDGTSIWYAY